MSQWLGGFCGYDFLEVSFRYTIEICTHEVMYHGIDRMNRSIYL